MCLVNTGPEDCKPAVQHAGTIAGFGACVKRVERQEREKQKNQKKKRTHTRAHTHTKQDKEYNSPQH